MDEFGGPGHIGSQMALLEFKLRLVFPIRGKILFPSRLPSFLHELDAGKILVVVFFFDRSNIKAVWDPGLKGPMIVAQWPGVT